MKNMKLDKTAKKYILNAISTAEYDVNPPKNDREKLIFLFNTFKSEYNHQILKIGYQNAMREWIMGLPSSFNVDFKNYEILQIAKKWGSLKNNSTKVQEYKILNNWFNFIVVKTFQLFKHYKIY
jgi:hypothetical protein